MDRLPIVDVDQHYYEPVDCCTRHLDPKFRDRAVHVAPDADGRPEWRIGDRPLDIERYPRNLTIGPGELERSLSARELWGEDPHADHTTRSGFQWYSSFATRPAMDTFAALIFHNLFGRFPGLKLLSVENGSRWVAPLLQELDAAYRFVAGNPLSTWIGGPVTTRPSELFKRHVYVAPFLDRGHEAHIPDLIDVLGAEHVLFGSDWPQGEGRDTPRHFDEELSGVGTDDLVKILRGNTANLRGIG